jgi:aryl-alcohol dehydrogenase-like predicted oxidoreductase
MHQDVIDVAFENGIHMLDTAEANTKGKSIEEICAGACVRFRRARVSER